VNEVNELIEINIDLVNELKYSGRRMEAYDLIQAHQENLRKNKEYGKKIIISKHNKIKKHIMINNGLCICGRTLAEGKTYCEQCLVYKKNYYYKRIEKGLCPNCGKINPTTKILCADCCTKKNNDYQNKRR